MFPRTKNRKAISTVLTTLIILVASVVLGTGVVLYGTSLFQTNAQSQSLATQGVKVWADAKWANGTAWGAADVRNSGDKLLSVDTISVRGTPIPFSSWYVDTNSSQVTSSNYEQALNYTGLVDGHGWMKDYTGANPTVYSTATCPAISAYPAAQNRIQINLVGSSSTNPILCLQQSSGPISLKPGASAVVYFRLPQSVLTTVDAGSSGSVAIYAGEVGAPQTVTIASQ